MGISIQFVARTSAALWWVSSIQFVDRNTIHGTQVTESIRYNFLLCATFDLACVFHLPVLDNYIWVNSMD